MFYRLVLIVGRSKYHSELSKTLTQEMKMQTVNVNLELSKHLLHQTSKQRKLSATKTMHQIIGEPETILLEHIEILFDVSLEQDPLRLLESLSRNRTIVAFWNGRVENSKLIYAEPGHPEYRNYSTEDLIVIDLHAMNEEG